MDKTSTGNNGTDNANKDKTGSRQALRKLLENAKVHFMQLGLKRKTVIFVMSTFIGAVLFTSFIFGVIYSNTWKRTVINHVKSIESEKEDGIRSYFENMDNLAYNICYSNWMQDIFKKSVSVVRRQEMEENARDFLGSLSTLYEGNQFAVIALNGTRVTGTDSYRLDYDVDIREKPWYEELLLNGKYVEAREGEDKGIYRNHPEWNMTIYYVVHDYNTLELTGFMVITVPLENIKKLLENGYEGTWLALEEKDGSSICSNLPGELDTGEKWEESEQIVKLDNRYYMSRKMLNTEFFQWILITVSDENYQKVNNPMVLLVFVGMLGFVGCLLILVALAVSRYLTKPILNCAGAMLEIRNNHIGIQIKNTYMDEIGELIDGFNEMSGSIYSLIEKNKMISALQKDAEIKMLERQINPHFLFNTLEIINSLILSKKEKKAVKVCETLGQLYRYNLKQNKWITLKEELEYTKQYLLIMKYKINDFSYFDDVDERLMEAPFMKAILQPLVENSIKHGFQRKNQECCISIIIHLKNEKIHIEVMDNGSGMEAVQQQLLSEEIQNIYEHPMKRLPETGHVGIKNVVQRLYLEYGDAFDVKIISNAGYGTRIEMEIPLERAGGEEEVYV